MPIPEINPSREHSDGSPVGANAREAALREILEVISANRGDEAPVFDVILTHARALCEAPMAVMILGQEGDAQQTIVADHGAEDAALRFFREGRASMDPEKSFSARVIVDARPMHIADLADTDGYRAGNPTTTMMVNEQGIKSVLLVPLIAKGRGIGVLALFRQEVRPFTDSQIALVETFAEQAVIAIENVRQFRELQTRLEREEASREILQVISRSRDDEAPVFAAILDKAARLCNVPIAGLQLVNQARTHFKIASQWGVNRGSFQTGAEMAIDGPTLHAQAMREARAIQIEDMADTALYTSGHPGRVQLVDDEGIRTVLVVPLIADGVAIGGISLSRLEVNPFSDDETALVETFAEQAVIAIENVRQFREVQTRLEREAALREILEVISQSRTDEMPVLETIVRNAARLCDATMAAVSLVNEARTHLLYTCIWGADQGIFKVGHEFDLNSPLQVATTVRETRIIHTHDLSDDPLYEARDPTRVKIVEEAGVRTFLTVPLVKDGVAFGCLNLNRFEVRPFDDADIALIETFAEQAVIAIDNVRQFRDLQTRLEREEASRKILQVISSSRADTTPVFDVILENAAGLCDAPTAGLHMLNSACTHTRLVSAWGLDHGTFKIGDEFELGTALAVTTAIQEVRVVHVSDTTADPLYAARNPVRVRMVEEEGIRVFLAVPLVSDGVAFGCITLSRRETLPFTEDEIALVETFAAQAVIAIENVRQFRELQTRLEREAATREILEVISRSRDDETPVFDAIIARARHLCNAAMVTIVMGREGGGAQAMIAHGGVTENTLALYRDGHYPMDPDISIAAKAIISRQTLHIKDMAETDGYRRGHPGFRSVVEKEGIRTNLFVPLVSGGEGMGCLILVRREVNPYTEDEIALVETFAEQAVIAIENVRQFRELQTRLEREEATSEVLKVISQSRDDEMPVFKIIQEHASRLCSAPFSGLFMLDKTGDNLKLVLHAKSEPTYVEHDAENAWPLSEASAMARAVLRKKVINIDSMSETNAYRDGDPQTIRAVEVEKITAFLAVPLLSNGQGIGCIGLYRTEPVPFTDDQVELVKTFAAQAVIAIQNVKQFKALEKLNSELGDRVDEQVEEIERVGRLKRFLPSAVADTVMSTGSEEMLKSHRAMIATLFCDIRGFTAFCESAEPEETIEVLQTFHETLGKLIHAAGAGFDHRAGDGIMVVFNDPVPCDDPARAALGVAIAMREVMVELCAKWRKLGHRMGFGVGISLGYATVGMVGFEGRYDYTANGTVVNLASRLCDHAADQEILISQRAATALEDYATVESAGELTLKGFHAPVDVCRVIDVKEKS